MEYLRMNMHGGVPPLFLTIYSVSFILSASQLFSSNCKCNQRLMELVAYFLFVKNKLQIITRKCIFYFQFLPRPQAFLITLRWF